MTTGRGRTSQPTGRADRLCVVCPWRPLQEKYKRLEAVLKAESMKKEKEERGHLPDPPKTAQDIWQQSVIGDYLARFKVSLPPVTHTEPSVGSILEQFRERLKKYSNAISV